MAFFETIKLEKGMYQVDGKSFTSILEELDPSENYKDTDLENLDAYQRQLKRFDIKVGGIGCDKVEKFFSTVESSVLFPEFLSRAIKQGIISRGIDDIIAAKTYTNSMDHRGFYLTNLTSTPIDVSENASPIECLVASETATKLLKKHGRIFTSTYEVVRAQSLDVFATYLRKMGMDIASEQLNDIATTITGNSNILKVLPETTVLEYSYIIDTMLKISPHEMNVLMMNKDTMKNFLSLPEIKDSTSGGLNYQGSGILAPFGAKLMCAAGMSNKNIIAFDKNATLQMIQSGDLVIDYDKVIEKQLERAVITLRSGFHPMITSACTVCDYN